MMHFPRLVVTLLVSIFLGSQPIIMASSPINEIDVYNSIMAHYPSIQAALAEVESNKGAYIFQQGVFDTQINASLSDRTNGHYDGQTQSVTLEKRLPLLQTSIYGGYRRSDGSFPSYEDEYITNDDGELLAGLQFSLLKNRRTDADRTAIKNALLRIDQATNKVQLIQLKTLNKGLKTYWKWVYYGHVLALYDELYELAEMRNRGIEARVKSGNAPSILLNESQLVLLNRKKQRLEAKNNLLVANLELALFIRDKNGIPITIQDTRAPIRWPHPTTLTKTPVEDAVIITLKNPVLNNLKADYEQEENNLQLATNQLLPKLDVTLEVSDDIDNGSQTRDETETKTKLSFEVPLEMRKARGKRQKTQQKLDAIKNKIQLATEQLKNEHAIYINSFKIQIAIYKNLQEQARLAKTLLDAETKQFRAGNSDLFLLNSRENARISAELKSLKQHVTLSHLYIDYKTLTADLNNLLLQEKEKQ